MADRKTSTLREVRRNWSSYAMLAPFTVLFLFFTIIPIVSAVCLSFTSFDMVRLPRFVGFSNYLRLILSDDIFLTTLKNTLLIAFITGPISFFACFFFAWMINDLPHRVRMLLTFVFYAPSISGSLFVIFAWVFSSDVYGFMNANLIRLGIVNEPVQWLSDPRYMLTIVMTVQIWMSLGAGFLSFIAGLQGIDRQLYEAGAIDGIRNRGQELIYITFPHMGPQLFFAAVMQIGACFSVSTVSIMLAGFPSTDYAADTIITYIMDVGNVRFEMGYASAIAVVLFFMMLLTNQIVRSLIKRVAD